MKPQELIYARESGYRDDIRTGHDEHAVETVGRFRAASSSGWETIITG